MLFVFFFKQKTAYEMRISDWSSDVCSSDLMRDAEGLTILVVEQNFDFIIDTADRVLLLERGRIIADLPAGDLHQPGRIDEFLGFGAAQLGRSSCRERVCQYV